MADQVTLFDLASKDGNLCWSLNPWKCMSPLPGSHLISFPLLFFFFLAPVFFFCWFHCPGSRLQAGITNSHSLARAALNFKGIPYKTEWLEYPDIKATLSAKESPPLDGSDGFPYTIPAVGLPDGRFVMNSRPIADELEKLKPEPSSASTTATSTAPRAPSAR